MKEGWVIKSLGDVCDILDSKRKPITKRNRIPGDIPYYGATGVLSYVKDYLFDEQLVLLGEDGAKWESGDNSAFIINGKTWVNNHAHVLRPKRDILDDYWIVYNLNFQNLMPFISGMTVPKLNQGNMRKIQIPIPPLPEQKQIVAILDKAFAAIDQAQANIEKNIENAKELFQSKLNEIFSQKGDGWEVKTLGEIGTLTSSKRIFKKEYVKEGVPFYRSKEIKELGNRKEISLELFISEERYEEIKEKFGIPKQGDVLLTAVGTIGEMYVVQKDDKFYFKDGNIMWLKDFEALNSYYLKYALSNYVEQLNSMSKGSAYSALTISTLKKYSIPVPSESKQIEIVNSLDELKRNTIDVETQYQQKLDNLEDLKKSILQKAFSGELTQKLVTV
ncbi:restriction endonuclease subunit S [Flagellimonas beolgyonensis]|uniref:restriction endonuclease subunit S n=1 Tax=Flagellimonas beolgyonensis TaxID=864064 RepID=UPI003D65A00B